jgi:hypothetical protein
MNIDYIIYGSVILGVLILLSNYIDLSYIVSKLFFSKKNNNVVVVPEKSTTKEQEFLQIISLWFQLKEKCEAFKLDIARDKLDEVFPLLNGVLENDS